MYDTGIYLLYRMVDRKKSNDPDFFLEEHQRILKKIGERIKALRKAKGHKSSEKFAFQHDLDRAQFGKYERGQVDMQISSLVKTLIALDVDIQEFFSEGFRDKKK